MIKSKKGSAEWYWMIIGIIIALVVVLFILTLFTEFGSGIRTSFGDILGLTSTENIEQLAN
jgi:hypothetical protein